MSAQTMPVPGDERPVFKPRHPDSTTHGAAKGAASAERAGNVGKAARFRELLRSPQLEFILEAHNGISARIVEEAGFPGIWASGLALSAQYGVRDSNEASWTQVLEMVEFMADATTVPILLDGDTGYGNFNNMRRLVRKLEQRGVAAVCIEDKVFPKTNSFINGSKQQLADVDEFSGKIKAGKDAAMGDDFSIVARVEALIAGWGMREALRRAEAYHRAGADGILIHSSKRTADEVLEFQRQWGNRCPLVIVPTKYFATPTRVFKDSGFSMVIWANHLLRSAVTAMRESARQVAREEAIATLEGKIASVQEIFDLQRAAELEAAEERYLPDDSAALRAIVLPRALSPSAKEGPHGDATARQRVREVVAAYNHAGVRDVTLAGSLGREVDAEPGLHFVERERRGAGELEALAELLETMAAGSRDVVISYADVLFRRDVVGGLDVEDEDFVIAVDPAEPAAGAAGASYVRCSRPCTRMGFRDRTLLVACGEEAPASERHGEWSGFLRVRSAALPRLIAAVDAIIGGSGNQNVRMNDLLSELIRRGEEISVVYMTGNWCVIDSDDNASSSAEAAAQ